VTSLKFKLCIYRRDLSVTNIASCINPYTVA